MIIIKQIYFEDFTSLACDIADKFDMVKDDFGDIAIIAKYEEAKEIIAELVCVGYSLESIEFDRPDWKEYYDEYLISLNFDGIWCQPMKLDGEYLIDDSTITYILDNCSSAVIPKCKGKVVFEVGILDDDECDCGECACKEDTNLSSAISKYFENGREITKEEFDKKYAEFENKYMDNIRDMLLNYCDLMDSFNEWQKRIW